MSAAGEYGILCDEHTFKLCKSSLQFEALPAITVKGKAGPIPIYRPSQRMVNEHFEDVPVMFGRVEEKGVLTLKVSNIALGRGDQSGGGVLVIEGEHGSGKVRCHDALTWPGHHLIPCAQSSLVGFVVSLCANAEVDVIVEVASLLYADQPFYVWRKILLSALGCSGFVRQQEIVDKVRMLSREGLPEKEAHTFHTCDLARALCGNADRWNRSRG